MRLEMIGLNHRTSSIEVREKAALGPGRIEAALNQLVDSENIEGATILSTCNRTELYLSPYQHHSSEQLQTMLQSVTGLSPAESANSYQLRDDKAVAHLFDVASGLDSQILGEKQILAQVKDAYHTALGQKTANSVLNRAFQTAIECSKEVHTVTALSQGAVSVAGAAVHVAGRIFGKLEKCKILLVGAGETARLAAKHLVSAGATEWRICNRTEANARVVVDLLGGQVVSFPPTPADIGWADLIVTATSSTKPVITSQAVKEGRLHARNPLLILDLAVPRDADPAIKQHPNLYLYCVDDFKDLVATNLEARKKEAVKAAKIVGKYTAEFTTWYQENRVAPTIRQIYAVLEELRLQELERNHHHFQEIDQAHLDLFSKSLMKKVGSLIVVNLKKASHDESDLEMAKAVTRALARDKSEGVNEILEKLEYELSH